MERKDILEHLKATEATIKQKIDDAQMKRNKILEQAQKQARKLEEDSEHHLRLENDQILTATKKEINEERQKVLKKATADADALKKKAQVKKAKDFFIQKFEDSLHV